MPACSDGRIASWSSRVHAMFLSASDGLSHPESIRKSYSASRWLNAVASGPTRFAAFPSCWKPNRVKGDGTAAKYSTSTSMAASLMCPIRCALQHRLERPVGHGADLVRQRGAKLSEGPQDVLAFVEAPVVADRDGDYRCSFRRGEQRANGIQLV